jgi:hypothetical protein
MRGRVYPMEYLPIHPPMMILLSGKKRRVLNK